MGDGGFVTVDRRDDGVAVVRLDRPKANALSLALLAELAEAARGLAGDPPGAVVVWGGPRIFAAGADIAEFTEPGSPGVIRPEAAREVAGAFRQATDALAAVPRAVIAALAGYALGGGCELALACDFRVAADTVRLGQPEVLLGVIPGGGGTQRLARLVGPARAKDLVMGGRQVGAAEALAMGLVDRVVPPDQVLDAALAWAGELAAGAVVAQGLAKQAVDGGASLPLDAALDLEADLFARSFSTADAATGVRSFLEHGPGKARFSGA